MIWVPRDFHAGESGWDSITAAGPRTEGIDPHLSTLSLQAVVNTFSN